MLLSRRRPEPANQIEGRSSPLVFSLRNGIAPPKLGALCAVTKGGFQGIGRSTPMAILQSPSGGSRPVPIGSRSHRSESPTGYSSTGCSPAEPTPLHGSLTMVADPGRASNALAQPHCKDNALPLVVFAVTQGVISTLHAGDISILRRHDMTHFNNAPNQWQTYCHDTTRSPAN
jgi:hypothetical protein